MGTLNPAQFGDYELRYRTEDTGASKYDHLVEAHHGGERVGYLHWQGTTGRVVNVDVDDVHQRKGVATAMWNHANSLPGVRKPQHSPHRTPKGDAWSKSVGGRRPRNTRNDPL